MVAGRPRKNALEGGRIRGVEGRGALRVELARGMLEALGIPAGEDQLGPFGACPAGRFEPDAGAAADHDDGLPEEFRFAPDGRGSFCCAHDFLRSAVFRLVSTAAEFIRVKRDKFPDAHRRPAGYPLHAVRLPVIPTRPVQLAHRNKMAVQVLRQRLLFQLLFPILGRDVSVRDLTVQRFAKILPRSRACPANADR